MKRARVIYNPTSGKEGMRRYLPDVLEMLEKAGYETSAHATTGEGDATTAAQTACERQYDLVVAAGGDGTLNEVIHGYANQPHRPKLGILPMGTTNDFARALKLPRDPKKATELILKGYSKKLDIGKVNDKHFMNIAGGGKLTELTYETSSKQKALLGQLAYYLKESKCFLPYVQLTSELIMTAMYVKKKSCFSLLRIPIQLVDLKSLLLEPS